MADGPNGPGGAAAERGVPERAAAITLTAIAWAVTAWVGVLQYRSAVSKAWFGVDIRPMKGAGQAVLAGRNVFDVHNFVYPPTAAVMSVPIAGVDTPLLARAVLVVTIVAVLAVCALSVHLFAPPRWWRPAAAALFAGIVMAGNTSYHALPLDNVSVLIAPFTLAVIWLLGTGRWWTGCIVLELSILLKPLLAAVVLVPLIAHRWLPLLVTAAVPAALLVASLQLGGGTTRAQQVLQHVLAGSILVGSRAVGNLSLTGFASVHHIGSTTVRSARLVVVVAAAGACLAALRFRRWDLAEVAWIVSVLVAATYLAGNLCEVHYLYTLIPGAVAVALRAPSRVARGLAVVALLAFCVPLWWVGNAGEQAVSLLGEVTLYAAAVLTVAVASVRTGHGRDEPGGLRSTTPRSGHALMDSPWVPMTWVRPSTSR
ncbi:MAG TPA: glycosyltransferase family 87 protein [Kineosporiaceae bacterium]|nr:glycosyltransferase family 87 protein [Kineosporiaceae bacterium]